MPRCYGSMTTIRRWKYDLERMGLWTEIWAILLDEAERLGLLDLAEQVIDGSISKARCGGEATGPNYMDKGRAGVKRSVLSCGNGIPLALAIAGANKSDIDLVRPTLENSLRPNKRGERPWATLLMDRGYPGPETKAVVEELGYIYKAPKAKDNDPMKTVKDAHWTREQSVKRTRIEPCHAWMQNRKAVLVRMERKKMHYEATCKAAIILVIWRKILTELTYPMAKAG